MKDYSSLKITFTQKPKDAVEYSETHLYEFGEDMGQSEAWDVFRSCFASLFGEKAAQSWFEHFGDESWD